MAHSQTARRKATDRALIKARLRLTPEQRCSRPLTMAEALAFARESKDSDFKRLALHRLMDIAGRRGKPQLAPLWDQISNLIRDHLTDEERTNEFLAEYAAHVPTDGKRVWAEELIARSVKERLEKPSADAPALQAKLAQAIAEKAEPKLPKPKKAKAGRTPWRNLADLQAQTAETRATGMPKAA